MSYGAYNRPNPYDQRDPAPGGYGAPPRQQQGYDQVPNQYTGRNDGYNQGYNNNHSLDGGYAGSAVEMAPLAYNGASVARADPNAILNECRDIDRGIDEVEQNLEQLRMIQQRTLDDADGSSSSAANRQLDTLSTETMALYRSLTDRVRTMKSNPESQTPKNNPQVSRVDRRLKQAIQHYQSVESQFQKRTQEQMARQYRIVRPNASEQEVREAVEDTSGGQVFSQALMQSDRQGRARAALSAVQDRHRALQKIEQQMVELSQLFQDMDTLVIQQEAAVTQIEQKGEEVVDNLDKGNVEIGVAVNTARSTRKKKWICLGISVAIIVIIVVVVVIYFLVIKGDDKDNSNNNNNSNNAKRGLEMIQTLPFISPVPVNSRITGRSVMSDHLTQYIKNRIIVPQRPA